MGRGLFENLIKTMAKDNNIPLLHTDEEEEKKKKASFVPRCSTPVTTTNTLSVHETEEIIKENSDNVR